MAELIAILRQDHRNLAALLDVLERQAVLLGDGGDADYALMESVLDYCSGYAEEAHHPREDLIYARLRELDGEIADAGSDLQAEHLELAALTRRAAEAIREVRFGGGVSRARIADLMRHFLATYRSHMTQEDTQLFPAALAALGPRDWAAIDARIGRRDDPLFGDKVEKRYEALRDYIHTLERIDEEEA